VREAAVPAVFRAFGDHLLYMEGKVYGLPADPLSGARDGGHRIRLGAPRGLSLRFVPSRRRL